MNLNRWTGFNGIHPDLTVCLKVGWLSNNWEDAATMTLQPNGAGTDYAHAVVSAMATCHVIDFLPVLSVFLLTLLICPRDEQLDWLID